MLNMKTLQERLRRALSQAGLRQVDLVKACHVTKGAVNQWVSGTTKTLEGANLTHAAKALGVSPHWLATGEGKMSDTPESPNIQHGITLDPNRRGYPIISYVQAGAWREIVDSFPRGGADEYILANSSYGPHTFALRIVGNSMEPEFREGDVVVIDPDVRPDPGNYVVARNDEEAATFKKYRPRGIVDGREVFELVPLNEDYAVMRSDQQPIQIIGTMVEHTRFRR
jgi:SOS-response transcriptional repressor LexA